MPSNRNYAVVPQAPSVGGQPAAVIPINSRVLNAATLPCTFTCSLASEQVVTNPAVPTSALVLAVPAASIMQGMPFDVLISGLLNQASGSFGLTLYQGSSLTPANNTAIKTIAGATFTGAMPFFIRASLIGDATSGKVVGTIKSLLNLTIGAEAAIAAALTVPSWSTDPVMQMCLSVTPSLASGSNYLRLYEFAVNF